MICCPKCGHQLADSNTLTARQRDVYVYLVEYIQKNHCAPSLHEIAEHFKYSSESGAKRVTDALEEKGFIRRRHDEARAITCMVRLDELGDPPADRGVLVRTM